MAMCQVLLLSFNSVFSATGDTVELREVLCEDCVCIESLIVSNVIGLDSFQHAMIVSWLCAIGSWGETKHTQEL